MKALILVDIQNDFLPGGNLAVPNGDEVIAVANKVQDKFDLIVATQDFHPADHKSFASQHEAKNPGDLVDLNGLDQILWPDHCVQGTEGTAFAGDLNQGKITKIFPKGTDIEIDSYSGFFDDGKRKATGLGDYLKENEVSDVFVMGLATDYCVKFTALDAVDLGFNTHLIEDGCRGVNLSPGDAEKAVEEMKARGITIISSKDL